MSFSLEIDQLRQYGLYDPAHEHDACGVGFVAHIKGQKSHTVVQQGLQIRWRRWLTEGMVEDWLAERAHYRLSLDADAADNPDQRVSEENGIELVVPLSAARVVLFGDAVLQPLGAPTVDVIATAKTDLPAGTVIDGLGGYHT